MSIYKMTFWVPIHPVHSEESAEDSSQDFPDTGAHTVLNQRMSKTVYSERNLNKGGFSRVWSLPDLGVTRVHASVNFSVLWA